MTKIFKSSKSTENYLKFLIAKNSDCKDWVEVVIDNEHKTFVAKKITLNSADGEWEIYNDYTFPSSLLNEFLNSD